MRSDYLDTLAFAACAVLGIAWMAASLWHRRVAREFESRLKDDNDKSTEL